MPIQVQGPDGNIIEFPDGTPQATMESALKAHYGQKRTVTPKAPSPEQLARATYDAAPAWQRTLISTGAEFSSLGHGIKQLYDAAADKVAPRSRSMSNLVTGNDPSRAAADRAAADAEAPFQDAPHGATNLAGRALPYLATLPLGGPEAGVLARIPQAGRAAQLAIKAGVAAGEGAGYGALREVRTGESRAQNAGGSALAGLIGRGTVGAVRRVAAGGRNGVDNVTREMIDTAQREGIPLHMSQVSDSYVTKALGSVAKYMPFSGSGKAARAQQDAWNSALTRHAGQESPRITDDAVKTMRDNFDRGYSDIWNRNNVTVSPQDYAALQNVLRETERSFGPNSDATQVVKAQIDHVLGSLDPSGAIPGRGYQLLRKQLAGVQPGTAVGQMVAKVRAVVDNAANASIGPQDAAALAALNRQYRNFRVLEELLKRPAGAKADISPAALWAAVNRRGPKATQELRDLAKVGQGVLKDPIPDSGTAPRLLIGGAAAGAGPTAGLSLMALAKLGAAGATLGRVLNSPAVGNYAANGLPIPQSQLARLLMQYGGTGLPRAAQGASHRDAPQPAISGY